MWDNLFASADLLQKGLEASWLRNSVIRNNIANVETPDFKSSNVEFESLFAKALYETSSFDNRTSSDRHIKFNSYSINGVNARVVLNDDTSMRMDGNNVDIEDENAKLAKNSIYYNTLMYKLNSELTKLKLAITEGK